MRIGVGDFDALGVLDGEITGEGDGPGMGDDVGEELDLYSRDSIMKHFFSFRRGVFLSFSVNDHLHS